MDSRYTHAAGHPVRVRQMQQNIVLPRLSGMHGINAAGAGDAWNATASIVFADPPSD